jgi:hypothetical protein
MESCGYRGVYGPKAPGLICKRQVPSDASVTPEVRHYSAVELMERMTMMVITVVMWRLHRKGSI